MKPHSGPWVQPHPPKKEKPVIALNIWPYMHLPRPSILHPPAQLEATTAHGSIEQATSQDLGAASLLVSRLPSARLCFFLGSSSVSNAVRAGPLAPRLLASSCLCTTQAARREAEGRSADRRYSPTAICRTADCSLPSTNRHRRLMHPASTKVR